jgi:3-methyladenine DNA glycosylase Mpg
MEDKEPKLENLFSTGGGFEEAVLVKAIQPFVTVQESTKEITTEQQILIYGITKKLLKSKGYIESELITAMEIVKNLKLKKGSVDPTFLKLKKSGFIVGKGSYEIPVSKLDEIITLLERK